mmetsp:Transcript_34312/g.52574  ORF Transcript_34312/g.52574 Transcript_34312/m.52574 type:complete len:160 (-) Transcript_34312:340-819(-)|eukprot:CAMPEP_0170478934 /NCGR_PEP_ID=MMETSP0208-20121228/345_1 /TAXON_ID=197538 /ORGANISM="Strombidium inclinatum, Strain S3" /LENGTH=159 /DNA_ID=CAMNT_0010751265 /DNA_START=23 /DNA_END=502 /DNA_ORIENTATION=+
MKYTSLLIVAALFAASSVEQTQAVYLAKKKKKEDPPPTAADTPTSGYFGADEDDVMNNIFNHYAVEVTNAAGQKTGNKVLYKDGAQKACAEVLLVTKQVSEAKMEQYMGEFFPRTWAKFDLNNAGEIDLSESHTFMRSLLGRLNQFVLAPGSLTDIGVE